MKWFVLYNNAQDWKICTEKQHVDPCAVEFKSLSAAKKWLTEKFRDEIANARMAIHSLDEIKKRDYL